MPKDTSRRSPYLKGRKVAVKGDFAGEQTPATDISGMTSAATPGRRRRKCLVIDNETLFAQFADLDLDGPSVTVGDRVPLLPGTRDAIRAFGTPPDQGDPGPDRYILDGEGATWLDPCFYLTGSHSIHDWRDGDAEHADYRRSAHLVVRLSRNGRKTALSYRLNEELARRRTLRSYFLKSPDQQQGINIEGLTAWKERLYFGLRSPVIGGNALMLSVRADALFSRNDDLQARITRVPLGDGVGIRDLAVLPDGRFLILAGPKLDAYDGYTINLLDRKRISVLYLGTIEPRAKQKPEVLFVADYARGQDGDDRATVLVMSDGATNGRPRLYELTIPHRRASERIRPQPLSTSNGRSG
jgi:hypothetical protein